MNVKLVIGYLDACLAEFSADGLKQLKLQLPIIVRCNPRTGDDLYRAVGIICDLDIGLGIGEGKGIFLDEAGDYLHSQGKVGAVCHAEGQVKAASGLLGIVNDGVCGELAVGDIDNLIMV